MAVPPRKALCAVAGHEWQQQADDGAFELEHISWPCFENWSLALPGLGQNQIRQPAGGYSISKFPSPLDRSLLPGYGNSFSMEIYESIPSCFASMTSVSKLPSCAEWEQHRFFLDGFSFLRLVLPDRAPISQCVVNGIESIAFNLGYTLSGMPAARTRAASMTSSSSSRLPTFTTRSRVSVKGFTTYGQQ
jgi:hypothetical protein